MRKRPSASVVVRAAALKLEVVSGVVRTSSTPGMPFSPFVTRPATVAGASFACVCAAQRSAPAAHASAKAAATNMTRASEFDMPVLSFCRRRKSA
jgi:hypothetical protein